MKTTEGYTYTVKDGLLRGLETDAVVDPKASGKATGKLYDAIVIGAGFAGLTAARDLSLLVSFHLAICRPVCNVGQQYIFCRAILSCWWRHGIGSEVAPGLPTSVASHGRWVALGFTGSKVSHVMITSSIVARQDAHCSPSVGFVWRELKRYGIDRDLKYTPDAQHPSKAYSTANLNGKTYKLSGEQLKILDDA